MKSSLYYCLLCSIACIICGIPLSPALAQDSTAADSALLKQIRQQMEASQKPSPSGSQTTAQPARAAQNAANPKISVIGDFQSLYTSGGDRNFDAFVKGVEFNFSSVIDPYARAEFYPVFEGEEGELKAEIEEAYLTTLSLPFNLQLKAGKFRQSFGRINIVHSHALPIIDVPLATENFLGEAMIDQGFSLSWLIPNSAFYQELILEVTRGPDENPLFTRSEGNVPQKLAHLKNFWALTDNATLELGLSAAFGENDLSRTSRLGGIDLTYKWKPVRYNRYKSFEWQTEFYFSNTDITADDHISSWGVYSWMKYQLSLRWFVTGMYSYSEKPFNDEIDEQALSATFGWYATEFQKLEFGPKLYSDNGFKDPVFSALLRWVFVIGTHGAHQY